MHLIIMWVSASQTSITYLNLALYLFHCIIFHKCHCMGGLWHIWRHLAALDKRSSPSFEHMVMEPDSILNVMMHAPIGHPLLLRQFLFPYVRQSLDSLLMVAWALHLWSPPLNPP